MLFVAPAWVLAAARTRRWRAFGAVFIGMVAGALLGFVSLPAFGAGASGQIDVGYGIAMVLLAILGSIPGAWVGLGLVAFADRRGGRREMA